MDIKTASLYLRSIDGISRAKRKEILTNLGLITTEDGVAKAKLGVAASIKTVTRSLKEQALAWMKSPFGLTTMTVLGIIAVAKAIDAITHSFEEMHEKHEEAKSSYEDITSELQSMQSELDTTKERIDELNGLEIRTSVEETELKNLEAKNALLSEQIEIQKRLQEYAERDVARTAAETLTQKDTYISGSTIVDGQEVLQFERTDVIDRTIKKQEELKALEEERAELVKDISEKGDEASEKELERYNNQIAIIDRAMASVDQEIASNLSTITDLYSGLFDANGNIIYGYEDLVARVRSLIPALTGVDMILHEKKQTIKDIFFENMSGKNLSGDLLGNYTNEFNNWVESLSETELGVVYELTLNTESATWSLSQWQDALEKAIPSSVYLFESLKNAVAGVVEQVSNVREALSSQSAGTSISTELFDTEWFKDYRGAIEYNNGMLRLNTDAVNDLVAAKVEEQIATVEADKALAQTKYLKNAKEIERLRKKLKQKNFEEGETKNTIQRAIDSMLAENKTLKNQCTQYDLMTASLREATSAYHNWVNAQNAGQSGDIFDSAKEAIKLIHDTLNDPTSEVYKKFNNEDYKAAVGFIIPDSIDHTDEKAINSYLKQLYTLVRKNSDGEVIGIDIAEICRQSVEQGLMVYDEAKKEYRIVAGKTMEDFANGLLDGYDMPLSIVQALFGELDEYVDLDWSDEAHKTFHDLAVDANEAAIALRDLNPEEPIDITLDVSDLETKSQKIATLRNTIRQMQKLKLDPEVSADDIEHANTIITYCVQSIQELNTPITMTIDTAQLSSDQAKAIELINTFESAYRNLELQVALGNTDGIADAQAEVEEIRAQVESSENAWLVKLKLDTTSAESLRRSIHKESLKNSLVSEWRIDDEAFVELQEDIEEPLTQEVVVDVDDSEFDEFVRRLDSKDFFVRVKIDEPSTSPSSTTGGGLGDTDREMVSATGNAFAGGTNTHRRVSSSKKTLVGEGGREIVVDPHSGKWYTVGDRGAEFVYLPTDAIVFNNEQTEDLLKNQFITGRAASLAGASMLSGNAMVAGTIPESIVTAVSKNSHSTKDDLEVLDWIEVAVDRISRAVDRLTNIASSAYKSLKTKLGASADAITKVNEQIAVQQAAYERYMKEAESVGLSADLKKRVQNGAIDLTEYDEDTRKLITDYKEWYDKALDASDATDELHESLADLYQERFDAIQEDYDSQLELMEHRTDALDAMIEEQETRGYLVSTKLYEQLQKAEEDRIATLQQQLADLEKSFSDAMNSGEIEKGSEAWYDMQTSINDVKSEIQDATIALQEYNNELRNLEWEHFEYQQERISALTDEADFLIELLSSEDMYDKNGKLTEAGQATIGLHGQNYNVYMAQADDYAKQIEQINKDLANDPNNTLLLEQKEEWIELQRESILAAEDEKQAMIALAEEGIQAELAAMQELIDARKEALDSAKDLHDYQNTIDGHNEEIGNIRKQLAAYKGDDSEETRAKLQKLQKDLDEAEKSLKETEYDRYIEDQTKLLDNLYTEYEALLNQKLDNTDALIKEMIGSVNANSASIAETITAAGDDVGYDISTEMKAIWGTDGVGGTISVYGDSITQELSAVELVLNDIREAVQGMVDESDKNAEEGTEGIDTTTEPEKPTAPDTPEVDEGRDPESIFQKKDPDSLFKPSPAPAEKEITIGGKVNAGNAKIYDYVGDTTGSNQYFSDDPIYTVLDDNGEYIQVRHHSLTNGVSGWFRKADVKAYKTGGLVDYTGLAWVDGQKGKPEAFLNAEDTENMRAFLDILNGVISGRINLGMSVGNDFKLRQGEINDLVASSVTPVVNDSNDQSTTNSFGDIHIAIDHVQDYEDFVNQLREDPKFERIVHAMTTDRLAKRGSLGKYHA